MAAILRVAVLRAARRARARPDAARISPVTHPLPAPRWLGLDAGGTHTRWALADAEGGVCAQGEASALAGQQLATAAGREAVLATLLSVAAQAGAVQAVVAGLTGFDASHSPAWCELAAPALGVPAAAVSAMSDIELACHADPDACVLYAGTGSIAAFIDAQGRLQRAGGRGAVIDDAGGGHWIARQALCQVWRAEDQTPGAWQASPLAQRLFAHIGGSDWGQTRRWVQGASRGELGRLALAVAQAADADPQALALLQRAGAELARLALALQRRHGPRPLVLAGRVWALHPAVLQGLLAALPAGTATRAPSRPAHHAAALMAAGHLQRRLAPQPA